MNQMKKIILIFLFSFSSGLLVAQSQSDSVFEKKFAPKETTIYYKLGKRVIQLKIFQYSDIKDIVMINLHADEITSVVAAHKLLETNGGLLIKIENDNKRNIRFRLGTLNYTFDPNGIFSREGITKSLTELGNISNAAVNEVEKFANRILQLLPVNPSCIIALHNNMEGQYSVTSYLPGNEKETDAKKVYVNPMQDPDDFFLTTDSNLYHKLISEKYNSILQDNEKAIKDGSLSVYCGEKKLRYLNCETQHGKTEQYLEMLMRAKNYIAKSITEPD